MLKGINMGKLKIGLDNRLRGNDLDKNLKDIDNIPDPKVEDDEADNDDGLTEEELEIKKSIDEELDEEIDEEIEDEDEDEDPQPKKKIKKEVKEEDDEDENKILKKNLSDSTREAMNLHFKNEKLNETIEEAANLPEPTEAELKEYATKQGAEWDELDVFSRNILRNSLVNDRRFEKIRSVQQESKRVDAWSKKVDAFIEDSVDTGKYPSLSTHDADFKKYVMKESRVGLDLNDLAASFLFGLDSTPARPKKKSLLLPSTSGQGGGEAVRKGLNESQVAFIRTHDPRKYRELIKSGKINLSI